MKGHHAIIASLAFAICVSLIACGGGGGGGTRPIQPQSLTWLEIPGLSVAEVGVAYTHQLKATGGTAPYRYSADANKPAWVNLDAATGMLTGTPTTGSGTPISFKVSVTDATNTSITSDFTLTTYAALTIDTSQVPTLYVNNAAWFCVKVLGGWGQMTATLTGLPPGLSATTGSINTDGSIQFSGMPTTAGSFQASLAIADAIGGKATWSIPLNVKNVLIVSSQSFRPVQGRPFRDSIKVLSGTPPFTLKVDSVPFGLTMSADGVISGTPLQQDVNQLPSGSSMQVTITDSDTPPQTVTFWDDVILYGPVRLNSLQNTLHTGNWENTTVATGGLGTLSVSVVSGSLPTGMSVSSGWLTGIPTQAGTFSATVHVEDQATPPQFADGVVTFTVQAPAPTIGSGSLPEGVIGKPYSGTVNVSGGVAPFKLTLLTQLPAGLSFQNDTIQGTPTETGWFPLTFRISDSSNPVQTTNATSTLGIHFFPTNSGRNDSVSTATPISGNTVASISPYDDPSSSGPDTDYYKLVATAGSVVTLEVDPTGPLDPMLEIVDGNGQRYKTCNDVSDDAPDPALGITPDPTPNGFDDDCMNDDVELGVIKSSRLQFKVPGTAGQTVPFYAHVFDWSGNARPDATYNLLLNGAGSQLTARPLQIDAYSNTPLPNASGRLSWNVQGGTQPYSYSLAPGSASLPDGIVLDPSGTVSGTPTHAGRTGVVLKVSDSSQPPQIANLEVDFWIADPISTPKTMPAAVTGVSYNQFFTATGGFAPVSVLYATWNPSQCCLVLGSQAMTGTPQRAGDFTVTYRVQDVYYTASTDSSLTIHVDPGPLTVTASVPPRSKVYNYYDLVLTPNGGSAPFTYGISGTIPPGLSLNTTTGELTGYPTQAGTYQVTLSTTDTRGVSATPIPVTIVVEP